MSNRPFLSLESENDLFSFPGGGTDRYYTNGLRLDYNFRKQRNQFPTSIMLKISDGKKVFGWGLAQYIFTPSRIDIETTQDSDRPYAGALFGIHSMNSYDNSKRIKLTSEFFWGVIGPLSFAEETQTAVHKVIQSPIPRGWKYQVLNDIILNYNLRLEKEMIYVPGKVFVTGIVETYAGTLYDAMGAGFAMRVGKINSLWNEDANDEQTRKSQLYLVFKPTLRAIYFNALLQGGVIRSITKSDQGYVLDKDSIERINVFTEAGITYSTPGFSVSVLQKMRSAPFKGGNALEFGSIRIAFTL